MKLAVISDIHGNYKALEAFLDYIRPLKIQGILCLGDYITDGPNPERTMELLYQMQETYVCRLVRGNREQYLIDNFYEPKGWKPSSSTGVLDYTARHLKEDDITFFESLPCTEQVEIEGYPALTICHGTPDNLSGNFRLDHDLRVKIMQSLTTHYLLGGHTHHQEVWKYQNKTYLNPGSLGLAIDGIGGRAEFAILHGEKKDWRSKLISISYHVDEFLQDFTAFGLDECGMIFNKAVKKSILTGHNYCYDLVCEAEGLFDMDFQNMTEENCKQVADKLGL